MTEAAFLSALDFAKKHPADFFDFSGDEIVFGKPEDLSGDEHYELITHLRNLSPWRKGPWRFFGHRIDANWQSHLKWNRVLEFADPMNGKKIADVGCNNGYYMFRMMHHEPEYVLGLDPVETFKRKHEFFRTLHEFPSLEYRKKGFEALSEYDNEFDIIFSMGILYHHTDPMEILRLMYSALKKNGQIILETLGYLPDNPGTYGMSNQCERDIFSKGIHDEIFASELLKNQNSIVPRKRYAGMKSVWNVPSPGTVQNWVARAGFKDVSLENIHRYDSEQVLTEWCRMPGLTEMLLEKNPDFTREGYPAPVRIYFSARK